MQEKFTFVYDKVRFPDDIQSISHGIDKEAGDIYRDWKSRLSKSYKQSVRLGGLQMVRQKKPKTVKSQDDWERTCDLFESDSFKVSEISSNKVLLLFVLILYFLSLCICH